MNRMAHHDINPNPIPSLTHPFSYTVQSIDRPTIPRASVCQLRGKICQISNSIDGSSTPPTPPCLPACLPACLMDKLSKFKQASKGGGFHKTTNNKKKRKEKKSTQCQDVQVRHYAPELRLASRQAMSE